MAVSNFPTTPGSGRNVAVETISGTDYGIVKLYDSTVGSSSPIGISGSPLYTTTTGLLVVNGTGTNIAGTSNAGVIASAFVTTAAPGYTTATVQPLSMDTAGNLRVSVSSTGSLTVVGPVSSGNTGSSQTNPVLAGGIFNTTQPTVTTGQVVSGQYTSRGAAIVATGVDAFAVSGDIASGTADSGKPVKIGGFASDVVPGGVSVGQRVNQWMGLNGVLMASQYTGNVSQGGDSTGMLQVTASNGTPTGSPGWYVGNAYYNGSTWDRVRGSATLGALTNIGSISGTAVTLGQKTDALSIPVVLSSGQVTVGGVAATNATAEGMVMQGIATTAAPTYTTGTTAALSLDTSGNLRTTASIAANSSINLNQVGGTAVVTGGVAGLLAVGGNVASGVADTGNPLKIGGIALTSLPAVVTTGQRVNATFTVNGVQIVTPSTGVVGSVGADGATVIEYASINGGTTASPTLHADYYFNGTNWDRQRGNTAGAFVQGNVASAIADAGNPVKVGGVFNTTQPTVTTGQRVDAQMTSRGAQIVATGVDVFNVSASSLPLPTGAATSANQTTIGSQTTKINDGTNTAAVKAASTAAAATDPALVVAISPNNTVPMNISQYGGAATTLGQKVSASSIPVVVASDQLPVAATITDGLATPSVTKIQVFPMTSDSVSATWNALRGAASGMNTAPTGMLAAQMVAQFDDVSPTGISENNSGLVRMSTNRNVYQTIRDGATNAERGLSINANNAAAVAGDVASSSGDSGFPVKVGAVYNSTLPTVTTGQRVDSQADANGRKIVTNAPLDGSKATYSAAVNNLAITATTPTDVFTITGSATKTVRITRITFSMNAAANIQIPLAIIKRSTANTAGTTNAVTAVPHDSASAAATATVVRYTANPTTGTSVGPMMAQLVVAQNTIGNPNLFWSWTAGRPSQAIVLRGVAQQLSINLTSTTINTPLLSCDIEWTEE